MAARSLGTLTLDLVTRLGGFEAGMDKAARSSGKLSKQWKKDLETVKRTSLAASAAVVAGVTAIAVSTVNASKEITRLSQVSGTTTREFQRYAAGAKFLRIEQEKLADIFKDTGDKVGDFLQTGGGPLADFFDNIAPQIGVTAEQFRNLSGPQALELYVSSLEKANLSQSEMTFFMEAIASDATALLPLLKNNASGFRQFGDEAEKAGAILSDQVISSAEELQTVMFLLDQGSQGFKNQLSAGLLPVLSDLAIQFSDVATNTTIAADAGEVLGSILKGLTSAGIGAFAAFDLAGRSIGALAAAVDAADINLADAISPIGIARKMIKNFGDVKAALDIGIEDIDERSQEYGEIINSIFAAGEEGGESQSGRVKELTKLLMEARQSFGGYSGAVVADFKEIEKGYIKQIELIGRLTEADKLRFEIEQGELKGANKEQKERLLGLANELEAVRALSEMQQNDASGIFGGAFSELANLESVETAIEESYQHRLDMLDKFRTEQSEKTAEWNEREEQLHREHQDRLQSIESARRMAQITAAESVFSDLAGIVKEFASEESSAYKALFAAQQAVLIAQTIMNAEAAAVAALAAPPVGLGPVAGATYGAVIRGIGYASAGIIAGQTIAGMAHDGIDSVPQTGTWLLEKGERVTTADTSARLDRTLDNIETKGMAPDWDIVVNNNAPDSRATARVDDKKRIVEIMIEQISNQSSPVRNALHSTSNVAPRGTR